MTDGKRNKSLPLVLSTSLGVVLAANLLGAQPLHAEDTVGSAQHEPKLVEWSNDDVKKFYNPSVDWNIAIPSQDASGQPSPTATPTPASGGGASSGGDTIIVNESHGGGFGWDDILLYHFLFNSGRPYSTSSWSHTHIVTDSRTHQTYQPRTYSSDTFQNKPVEGSTVRPKTSAKTGSFTSSASKSTSSSTGSIGGKSSSFSSSGKSSGSSFSS